MNEDQPVSSFFAPAWRGWVFSAPNSFIRHFAVLAGGTVIAQAIPIAALPVLTRLYPPSSFGTLALFTTMLGVTAVVATGRFELAIVLPREDSDGATVGLLACVCGFVVSLLLTIAVVAWGEPIARALRVQGSTAWMLLLPIATLATAAYQAASYLANRRRDFARMARSRIVQTGVTAIVAVGAGLVDPRPAVLIAAAVAGAIAAVLALVPSIQSDLRMMRSATRTRAAALAKRYLDFPRFYAPGALCDNAAAAAPVVILTHVYGLATSGFFGLTTRIVSGPASIISTSVGQVLLTRLVERRHKQEALAGLICRAALRLAALALGPLLILVFFGPRLFATFLGAKWFIAGQMARIMAIGFAVKFVVSPLSIALSVVDRVRLGSLWQAGYLAVTLAVLSLATKLPVLSALRWWTAAEVTSYVVYFLLIVYATAKPVPAT